MTEIPAERALTVTMEMPERTDLPYTPRYTIDLDLATVRQLLAAGRTSDIGWHLAPAIKELLAAYDDQRQPERSVEAEQPVRRTS